MDNRTLIDKLNEVHVLSYLEWFQLLDTFSEIDREYASTIAREISVRNFGKKIYFRGIIEFSNYCKNDCLYCGIRRSNVNAKRYRLSDEEILKCCEEGYEFGFRTFVLQSGEDYKNTDERMCGLISSIKGKYPDCAITLSIGERTKESYKKMYEAGADRYLLRHETADENHYNKLHPSEMSFNNRMECLTYLKDIGYQTGCGCMVGTPFQTTDCLVKDMMFMNEFKPEMIGIGPFIPHKETPFADKPTGNIKKTLMLLSLCRIMQPDVMLPSTTALGTAEVEGRAEGVLAGCNVVMPNLSPLSVRKSYMLYNNKAGTQDNAKTGIEILSRQMKNIGYEVICSRGDWKAEGEDKT